MSISTPSAGNRTMSRRTGRPAADDREAASPTGRWLHRLESDVFGIAFTCIRGRNAQPLWLQHDAMADATVRANEAIGRGLLGHADPAVRDAGLEIVGNCAVYYRVDASEDACTRGLFGLLADIHDTVRRVAAMIERTCAVLRGRS
jgi:hypothetical protein